MKTKEQIIEEAVEEFESISPHFLEFDVQSGSRFLDKEYIEKFLRQKISEAYEAGRKTKGSSWREGYQRGYEEAKKKL